MPQRALRLRFDERAADSVEQCRAQLAEAKAGMSAAHAAKIRPGRLLRSHSDFIDNMLSSLWKGLVEEESTPSRLALIAVGGYGRQELHPGSDIDLLILRARDSSNSESVKIESFIRFLWDVGLQVGHSTRTLQECVSQAKADITVVTNLMEARHLSGDPTLLDRLAIRVAPERMWSPRKFFEAKRQEQIQRHQRYGETAYNLEPHVKEGPGGLRDIQTIQWVGHRYFGTPDLEKLSDEGFLTNAEVRELLSGRELLWRLRNGLHLLTGRSEDRLLFDYQREIASEFGYRDGAQLAVEKLMKRYFQTVKKLRVLNEILLQHFEEAILTTSKRQVTPINRRFRTVDGLLEAANPNVFKRQPFALLEAFLLLIQEPGVRDFRGDTVRLIRKHLKLIDGNFRRDIRCRSLFMEILKSPRGQTRALRKMDAYGVLGAYLPAFGRVVGQMQHDLFHAYTVDAHLLFVLRNLRRMDLPQHDHELPDCSRLMQGLFKKHRLYLAALFHDIAKGRGGDHSTLGERDALRFCRDHDLSDYDMKFVAWLVRTHLRMSWVAQRQDISDPDVIDQFASEVGDQERLDNLYLLTVADMRGTSPKVWNDWKAKLLLDLYHGTSQALRRGKGQPVQLEERIRDVQQETLRILGTESSPMASQLWAQFDQDYFLRNSPEDIAWHATLLLARRAAEFPLIEIRRDAASGTSRFLFCCPDSEDLLCRVTAGLDRLNLNIVDARVHRLSSNLVIMIFVILTANNEAAQQFRSDTVIERLRANLLTKDWEPPARRVRVPRALKHFPIETTVQFSESETEDGPTVMEVVAQDRPGLLLQVAKALLSCKIHLANAKVGTFGARAEDIFYVTDRDGLPIKDMAQRELIADQIRSALP
tara:strand:- start:209 stop:2830 length:2622 start_codon:yes stop_codon:yes gene_type:complete